MTPPEPQLPPGLAALVAGMAREEAPPLPVQLRAPDLRDLGRGNVLPGVWSFRAEEPGPHVAVVALVHGNEIGGAIVLEHWLRAGLRPRRGRLSLIFANLDAYGHFDPEDPTASRFLEEDLNRLWSTEVLEGGRRSAELRRARVLRPLLDTVDLLLDLHSMLWPSDPLILAGSTQRGAEMGMALGFPPLVVQDQGHEAGARLIDYAPFLESGSHRTAVLLEAGEHWQAATPRIMAETAGRFLRLTGCVAADDPALAPAPGRPRPRLAVVTQTVTAATNRFAFLRPWRGGEVVPARNTLLALDGEQEIRTPHDDCVLVMPSLRVARGHTAVRLARFLDA